MIKPMKKCISVKKNKNQKNNKKNIFLIASFVFLVLVAVGGQIGFSESDTFDSVYLTDNSTVLYEGKEYKGNCIEIINELDLIREERVEIIFSDFDDKAINNPVIFTRLLNCPMLVYLDEDEIYSIGADKKFGEVIGNTHIKIPLPNDYKGKEIKIVYTLFDIASIGSMEDYVIMNSKEAEQAFLYKNIISIYCGIFMTIAGLLGLLFVLYNFSTDYEIRKELWLSLMSFFGGVWIVACFDILQYWIESYAVKYYIEYEALYLMVIFMTLYISEGLLRTRKKILVEIDLAIMVFFVVLTNVLRAFKVVYYLEFQTTFMILVCLTIGMFIYYGLKNEQSNKKLIVTGAIVLSAVCITYLLSEVFFVHKIESSLSMIAVVLLIVDSFLFMGYVSEIEKSYIDNAQKQSLVNLAYKDSLTGIANRRACEKYMEEIDEDDENEYIIYSFDIDSLKKINDKYGHKAGDQLIISFAKVLEKVFRENGGFYGRMGGDEFFAAQKNKSIELTDKIIRELTEGVNNVNNTWENEFDLSYSVGYSLCDRKKGLSAWITYNIADNEMYDKKTKKKQINNK